MHCPFCQVEETKVVDSRLTDNGAQVRRRRECLACQERFSTRESIEWNLPRVIKRDGTRVVFDADKLLAGLIKSLEKREVNTDEIALAVERITQRLLSRGEREVTTEVIGEYVMDELRALDPVAYVRFASVYRSFKDVSEFHAEIEKLKQE